MTPLAQNVAYLLTKHLHNGRVQTGTGVSCMESRWGSTGFTAMWSLPWSIEPAVALALSSLFALACHSCVSSKWPFSQCFNQAMSASLARRMDGVSSELSGRARFVCRQLSPPHTADRWRRKLRAAQQDFNSINAINFLKIGFI